MTTSTVMSACERCVGVGDCFFRRLPTDLQEQVRPLLVEKAFAAGEVLTHPGILADRLQMVKTGQVVCRGQAAAPSNQILALMGPGMLLGLGAVWDTPILMHVQASHAGRLCSVSMHSLRSRQLLNEPFMRVLGAYQLAYVGRVMDWLRVARLKGLAAQLLGVLCLLRREQRSTLVRLPPHNILAGLLGCSRETVVRTLAQLEAQGRILRQDANYYEVREVDDFDISQLSC